MPSPEGFSPRCRPLAGVALSIMLGLTVLLGLLLGAPGAAARQSTPRVMGGSPAPSDPRVVSLAMSFAGAWSQCSGAMWRPRLIITAAHCVTPSGSSGNVDKVAIFPPGVPAQTYRDIGPQGPSDAQVTAILKFPGYVNGSDKVSPHDIAILVLDRDLAPSGFRRLATLPEIDRWLSQSALVTHVGYGLTAPAQRTLIPNAAALPLSVVSSGPAGVRFGTAATLQVGTCPGDSGSPAYRPTDAGDLLIGITAGSSAPCTAGASGFPAPGLPANVGFVGLGYPDLLDAATAAAGYAPIPGAPSAVGVGWLPGSPGSVVVAWQPTLRNPSAVTSIDVWEGESVVCRATAQASCEVTNAAPGVHAYRVRSANADGEGGGTEDVATLEVPMPAGAALSALAPRGDAAAPWIVGRPIVAFAGCLQRRPERSALTIDGLRGTRTAAIGMVRRDPLLCPSVKRPLALTYDLTLAADDVTRLSASGRGRVVARSTVDQRVQTVRRPAFASVHDWATTLPTIAVGQ